MPPWAPQLEACLKTITGPPIMSFCTISRDGMPKARSVVFRSWLFEDKSTGVIMFSTDKRMGKIDDLTSNDGRFEANMYFPEEMIQFRFSGFAQLLSPERPLPTLASSIAPSIPLGTPPTRSNSSTPSPSGANTPTTSFYPVFTPSFHSEGNYETEFPPPSKDEWMKEYERMWDQSPTHIKQSFKKPPPGRLLTPENQHRLDAISRGVDGSSDESGKENFVVVLMFLNTVDQLSLSSDRRALFTRKKYDEWIEEDICP